MKICAIENCINQNHSKGLCNKHRQRVARNGNPYEIKRIYNDEERFWANIYNIPNDGCWIWGGRIINGGYGHMLVSGKLKLAHRYSYEQFVGIIPKHLTVDHICNNPPCVNPNHLQLLTQKENNLRSKKFGANKTHCPYGHEYTKENTYERPNKRGYSQWRDCKECISRRGREYRARKKALL